MIVVGGQRFGKISQEQVDQIKSRCQTETFSAIGVNIGLNAQRVGEIAKLLNIDVPRRSGLQRKPFEALYHILLTDAARRASGPTSVELSYEQFREFTSIKTCHYCSEPVYWSERINREKGPTSYNLDRKDNTLGYTKENCVVCCSFCNRTKGNLFTYEEFKLVAGVIRHIFRVRKLKANMTETSKKE